jgi:alpha-glucosidase
VSGLELTTGSDPWALSFGVLAQAAAARFSCEPRWRPGPVREDQGDPALDGQWYQVTKAATAERTADRYAAVLATSHPDGLTAALEIRTGSEQMSVTLRIEGAAVVAQSFAAAAGERFLGFGERSHAASLDRGVIENYVGEGPYQDYEYPFLVGTVPPWAMRERLDATYFPLPWVLSTAGFGVSIDQDELSYVRLRTASQDSWSIETEASWLAYTVYAGPAPLDALRRYTAAAGRQPEPQRWFFGPWYQSGHENHIPLETEQQQLQALAGAAVSAAETHCRYLPLGEDRGYEESERARTAAFHAAGLAALSYLNPIVARDYPEAFGPAEEAGVLQRHDSGEPYLYQGYAGGRVPPHTDETQYDFTAPTAAACWAAVAARVAAAGYDGWMEDFGEYTPLDAVTFDGQTGTAPHNRYPTQFHTAAAEAAAELEQRYGRHLARFVRSGWRGTAPVVPIVWGGDPTTGWGFDGLASAVTCGLSMGASGVAMWGSDTGGFMSTVERLTPELLRRWIQFSAFCPVMRTKAAGIEVPAYERPQIWDPDVLPVWQRWADWHTRLNDYLMAAHDIYRQTGRPIMCALELVYPDIGDVPDQYLLGEHLLVAPVLEPDCTARTVILPEGSWLDLFDPRRAVTGPATVSVPVGPDDIPVFARAGALVALLPEGTGSLSPYAPALDSRRSVLAFPAAPGTSWAGPLGPGLSGRSSWGEGTWTLELSGPGDGSYEVTAWLPAEPAAVEADGSWSFAGGALSCTTLGASAIIRARWSAGA